MKLSEVKKVLSTLTEVNFRLPDGQRLAAHFHVTEVGQINKSFIDCGGVVRHETVVNFQLWNADDVDHRLKPQKMFNIIELSEKVLNIQDHEVEVEYQNTTIGKYDLDFDGNDFILKNKQTACLAEDACGIPSQKPKMKLSEIQKNTSCCNPSTGCC